MHSISPTFEVAVIFNKNMFALFLDDSSYTFDLGKNVPCLVYKGEKNRN